MERLHPIKRTKEVIQSLGGVIARFAGLHYEKPDDSNEASSRAEAERIYKNFLDEQNR